MKEKLKKSKYFTVLLLVIPCIIILLMAFLWFQDALRTSINETDYEIMQETARQQMLSLETKMQGQLNQLQLYARSFGNVDMNDYTQLKETLNVTEGAGSFETISIATMTGNLMNNHNTSAGNVMKELYFQEALKGKASVGVDKLTEQNGEMKFIFAVPVYQNEKIVGVLVGAELQSRINESVMTDSFSGIGASYVIDQEGEILLQSKNGEKHIGKEVNYLDYLQKSGDDVAKQIKDDIRKEVPDVYRYRVRGAEYITIRNPMSMNGWNLILQVNASFVNSQSAQIFMYVLTLLFWVMVCMLVIVIALFCIQNRSDLLKNEAESDLLTGLLNKKTFERSVANMVLNHSRDEKGALLIIDLDNFKGINDNLGHMVGDQVLAKVADKMRETFRQQDYLGRIGGDEFAVYLMFSNISDIEERREIICNRAEQFGRSVGNIAAEIEKEATISCSIGIAMDPEHGLNYNQLYQNADQALYQSKEGGKNRYHIYDV